MNYELVILLCLAFVLFPRVVRTNGRGVHLGIGWLLLLVIAVATTVLAAVLTPKPKKPKPPSAADLADPTNDAGRAMMVVFGEGVVKSPNVLWFGEKGAYTYETKAPTT